jgi:hypothetical protein
MNQAKNHLTAFKDDCFIGWVAGAMSQQIQGATILKKHGLLVSLGALAKKGLLCLLEYYNIIFITRR